MNNMSAIDASNRWFNENAKLINLSEIHIDKLEGMDNAARALRVDMEAESSTSSIVIWEGGGYHLQIFDATSGTEIEDDYRSAASSDEVVSKLSYLIERLTETRHFRDEGIDEG